MLARLKFDCDIIVLSECWLSKVSSLPTIEGYSSHKTSRNYNQNDGVVVMINDRHNFEVEEPHFVEANCLVIKFGTNHVAIIAIYRSPSFKNLDNFLSSLNDLLDKLSHFCNIVITGDININILNDDANSSAYLDITSFYGLLPAIYSPTRGKNCLDHVIVRTNQSAITFNLQTTISDHNAILFCLNYKKSRKARDIKVIKKINWEGAVRDCSGIDFGLIYNEVDPNSATSMFVNMMSDLILKHTLILKIPRNKTLLKPWITTGLLRCIRNRDMMHLKTKKESNNLILCSTYKRYRNFCNNLLKKLKRQYEKDQLLMAKDNSKKLWTTIKTITNYSKEKNINSQDLLSANSSPKSSINAANEFFASVGSRLAQSIPPTPPFRNISEHKEISSCNSFVLLKVDCGEVKRIILNLKCDCRAGWDNISSGFLQRVVDFVAPVLTMLINRCLEAGVFPNALKKSILVPIHKAGDTDCVNNYRPISILTSLSKIFERIINSRLIKYLESKKLLSPSQYGFRADKSTDDALHDFTTFLVRKMDANEKCITIFLDLAKAFDTVCISKLLNKLNCMGIRGKQLDLFADYLSGRSQCVSIGEHVSDDLEVTYGVPQGSILGPTLFLCYINELCQLQIQDCKIISYADDTTLTFVGDTWEEAYTKAQAGFNTVCHWLAANSLTLNSDKTKLMQFSIRNPPENAFNVYQIFAHKCSVPPVSQCSNCPLIKAAKSIRYLGVTFDNRLSFGEHIHNIAQKVRKLTYIFRKLRHVADRKTLIMVYYALIQSIVTYCITTWGGTDKTKLLKLERAQRLILKVTFFKPRLFSTWKLYQDTGVLTVRQLFILFSVLRQHKDLLAFKPDIINKRRHYAVIKTYKTKTSFAQRFYNFIGPRLYNQINKFKKTSNCSTQQFKRKVTSWLLELDYQKTEELLAIKK